jgi:hypothetical protein
VGAAQYWRKFIANFSSITAPLHVETSVKQVFQWGGKQQRAFDTLKEKISLAPVLALPNLRQPFEIQTDASNYAMGAVLLQHGKPICFHFETFNGAVINYPTYDKELYALVQSVKNGKIICWGKKPLSTQIINHCNTYNHKQSYNKKGTSDGWVFYNNSTWS